MIKKTLKAMSQFQDENDSPGFLLWRTHLVWKRKIEATLLKYDLTHIQFVLLTGLWFLTQNGELITQQTLSKFTYCDVNMTSQVLRVLEKKGWILRVRKEGDERGKYPTLTNEGSSILKKCLPKVEEVDQEFFGVLKKEQLPFQKHLKMLLGV